MKRIEIFFLFALFSIPYMPSFSAIDPMATQWVYLSITLIGYLFYKFYSPSINFFFPSNYTTTSFIVVFFISFLSLLISLNLAESIISLSRLFILFCLLLVYLSIIFSYSFTPKNFFQIFVYLLLIESLYFFFKLFILFNTYDVVDFKGITSNVNIQSFSILIKIPFLFFGYLYKFINRLTFYLTSLFSISIIFLISSRAALATLILFLVFYVSYLIYKRQDFKKYSISLVLSICLSSLYTFFYVLPAISQSSKIKSLSLLNKSTYDRISFYTEAISTMIQNPFLGIGIGNWKIHSILTHKEILSSYTTPYHAHNDFLQFGAETGFIGFSFFLFFILSPLLYIYRLRFNNFFKFLFVPILSAFFIYLIDSTFNFPIDRPLIQIQFLFILAIIFFYSKEYFKVHHVNKGLISILILLVSLSGFISYKVYDSYVKQNYLLSDFNNQQFDTSLEIINSIDDNFPNITATGLPVKAIKANYFNNDSIVSRLLNLSILDNPYIKYPQALKAIRFKTTYSLDSALYYARDAYNGIPNNELHIITYMSILTDLNDSKTLDSLFSASKHLNSQNVLNAYLRYSLLIDEPFNEERFSIYKDAAQLYPTDPRFESYKSAYFMGDSLVNLTAKLSSKATAFFDNKEFLKSAEIFLEASNFDPADPSFLENAGHAFYLNKQKNKANQLFDSVINYYPNSKGKAHYLKGLMIVESTGDINESCKLFNIARKRGNTDAEKAIKLFCK